MTSAPIGLSFFAPAHGFHGILRGGVSVLFQGSGARALPEPVALVATADGYGAKLADRLDLAFAPISEPAELAGRTMRVCRVTGTVEGRQLECLGTAAEIEVPPSWGELDAVRSVSAIWDAETAVMLDAQRPRFARGHGQERVRAWLLAGGRLREVEEARLSTIYDAHGRQRTAGLELWLEEEDLPRRSSGTAVAGTSLQLEGLRVDAAVFTWAMDGREGFGAYELAVREERAAA